MRSPDKSARSVGEIAAEIHELFLTNAKAEAAESAKAVADPLAREAIMWAAGVRIAFEATTEIKTLRARVEPGVPLWGYETENREAFALVNGAIEVLQSKLRKMPGRALLLLFAKDLTGSETDIPPIEIQREAIARARRFSGLMAAVGARCTALVDASPGEHKGADWIQRICCDAAWNFLVRNGKQPSKTNSAASLFRKVARLFYEGVTGNDIDLEYACAQTFERKKKRLKRKKD